MPSLTQRAGLAVCERGVCGESACWASEGTFKWQFEGLLYHTEFPLTSGFSKLKATLASWLAAWHTCGGLKFKGLLLQCGSATELSEDECCTACWTGQSLLLCKLQPVWCTAEFTDACSLWESV